MKRQICAALLMIAVATLAVAAPHQRLRFIEHAIHEVTTPVGGRADAPGNLLTFANPVFDATDRTQVGRDQGFCIRVVPASSWECFWTLFAPGGQITVEGPFLDSGDSHLSVTGGTGKYAGARGEMLLHSRGPAANEYEFTYDLL